MAGRDWDSRRRLPLVELLTALTAVGERTDYNKGFKFCQCWATFWI